MSSWRSPPQAAPPSGSTPSLFGPRSLGSTVATPHTGAVAAQTFYTTAPDTDTRDIRVQQDCLALLKRCSQLEVFSRCTSSLPIQPVIQAELHASRTEGQARADQHQQ